MKLKAKMRGSASGCLARFLGLAVLFYLLVSWLPQCMQELPQMAGNAAAQAGNGIKHAAANTASSWGRRLLDRIEGLFGAQSPAEQFEQVCDHIPVEGVDKLCPYFTAAMQGATKAQARQTSCYLTAAGKAPNGQQTLQSIHQTCPQTPNNASAFQSCVENYVNTYVESGDVSSCQMSSAQQFEQEVHDLIEPIACIPGLPKSWCTTSSSGSTTAPDTSSATRTDANYLNCLQRYYLDPGVQPLLTGQSCGTQVTAANAQCVVGQLSNLRPYAGQNLGPQYIEQCNGTSP